MTDKFTSPDPRPKVFVLSLHRTGTKSTHCLLSWMGYKSVHRPRYLNGVDLEDIVRGVEHDLEAVWSKLTPILRHYEAFSDVPFPVLYTQASRCFGNAKFILIRRDPLSWSESVKRHMDRHALLPCSRVMYWPYLPRRPDSLESLSNDDFIDVCERHEAGIREFFTQMPERLLICDLRDPSIGKNIAAFLDKPYVFELPHVCSAAAEVEFVCREKAFSREVYSRMRQAIAEDPLNPYLQRLLHLARNPDSHGETSCQAKRRAIQVIKKHPKLFLQICDRLLGGDDLHEAEDLLQLDLDVHPGDADALQRMGELLRERKDFKASERLFREALAVDRLHHKSQRGLFRVLRDTKRRNEAAHEAMQVVRTTIRRTELFEYFAFGLRVWRCDLLREAAIKAVVLSGGIRPFATDAVRAGGRAVTGWFR